MNSRIITYVPVLLGLALLVFFTLRGRISLGIATGVVTILALWFAAQVLIIDYKDCLRYECSLTTHLRSFYGERGFFILGVVPLSVAVLISRPLIIKGKLLSGFPLGLAPIVLIWASAMVSLLSCKGELLECEWVGVGFIFHTVLAILQSIALLLIGLLFFWANRRLRTQEA